MYIDREMMTDGWTDNLSEQIARMDEERMRRVYRQFEAGVKAGRPIADMAGEFSLNQEQIKSMLRRIKLRKYNPKTMKGDC